MKKIFLSFFVIAIFGFYVLHQKQEQSEGVVLPPSTPTTSSGSISNTGTSGTSGASGTSQATSSTTQGAYKDGTYTGSAADAFYGTIQVKVTISGGKITDVAFLQYPNDRGQSIMINQQAMPLLKQEAITAQNAQVNIVSGATDSSQAFRESLAQALSQASN